MRSPKIREKLINEGSDLTLEKAIDIARTYELSKQQLKTMNGEDTSINSLRRKPAQRTQPQANFSQRTKGMTKDEYVRPKYANSQKTRRNRNYCGKCGREHGRNEKCHAEGKKCNQCLKMNHFAAMCKTKSYKSRNPKKKIHTIEFDSSSDDEFDVGRIDTPVHNLDNTWYQISTRHRSEI